MPTEGVLRAALEAVLALEGTAVYAVVGVLSWAEAAFFLGLVTPGELAMAAGGVLSSRGQAALAGVGTAAAVGTVVGNATGYWMGRAWGARLLEWRPLQRFLGRPIDATRSFFYRRGPWAVVFGRFISYVRIFVPFLAGASGMTFRRFTAYDLPAAVVWSVGWVVLGFLLAESWQALVTAVGPAAFLVLILFVLALVIRWLAVRAARRPEPIQGAARRVAGGRVAARLRRWVAGLFGWLGRRFDPRLAPGLGLTLGFLCLLAGAAGVGLVLSDTRAVRGLALFDFPVLEWMATTRTPEAVRAARNALWAFQWPGMIVPALLTAGLVGWRAGWWAGARALLGVLGGGLGAHLLDAWVLEGVVPRAQFPAPAVAVAAAIMVHTTVAVGARGPAWGRSVTMAALGLFLACTISLATLVAGWSAPSGVVLGFALGLAWSAAVEMQPRLV